MPTISLSSVAQIIPFTSAPNQTLPVTLNIDGGNQVPLTITMGFKEMASQWVMGFFDQSGNLIIDSIPVVTGDYPGANLLQQYPHLGIGSWFCINVSGSNAAGDSPNSTNLGTDFLILADNTATT